MTMHPTTLQLPFPRNAAIDAVDRLCTGLTYALGRGVRAVVLDLSEAGYIGAAALGATVRMQHEAAAAGAAFVLAGADVALRRALFAAGLDPHVAFTPDVPAALALLAERHSSPAGTSRAGSSSPAPLP